LASAERRAEEAEARVAAMRAALEARKVCSRCDGSRGHLDFDRGEWRPCKRCDGTGVEPDIATAIAPDAGRAILDRLAAAEAERDAMRAEVKKEAAMRAEMAAEIKRLRARKAARCSKCAACPGWLRDRTGLPNVKCHVCGGTGAVIVEGEK
jgi:DnaJ-class molecular chaperone